MTRGALIRYLDTGNLSNVDIMTKQIEALVRTATRRTVYKVGKLHYFTVMLLKDNILYQHTILDNYTMILR